MLIILIVGGGEETVIIQYIEAELSWYLQGFSQHKPVDLKSFWQKLFLLFHQASKICSEWTDISKWTGMSCACCKTTVPLYCEQIYLYVAVPVKDCSMSCSEKWDQNGKKFQQ